MDSVGLNHQGYTQAEDGMFPGPEVVMAGRYETNDGVSLEIDEIAEGI
jgi:hypothetical protein